MYQHLYQKFLEGHQDKIHLAAHSHYFWPDVSLQGHIDYWMDASKYSDTKWEKILGEKLETAQKHIAEILNLKNHKNIAFAPNTHELLTRLLSCFLGNKVLKILTTDSEFHSFSRQIKRLEEFDALKVTYLNTEDEGFEQKLLNQTQEDFDLIFISQVFFNSGKVIKTSLLEEMVNLKSQETIMVVDGYHGFCAVPTDLSSLEDKVFYLAGGYKYAQAGEGMCFMAIPADCKLRPAYTGWFASFSTLESSGDASDLIQYDNNGWRFWGSTQDLSALYRFNNVWDLFKKLDLNSKKIHDYIQQLQHFFIQNFQGKKYLIHTDLNEVGHFLTLNFSSYSNAQQAHQYLLSKNIMTDFRRNRLRIGLGIYITQSDLEKALEVFNSQEFLNLLN